MSNGDSPYVEAFRRCVLVAALAHARSSGDTETVAWLEARGGTDRPVIGLEEQ